MMNFDGQDIAPSNQVGDGNVAGIEGGFGGTADVGGGGGAIIYGAAGHIAAENLAAVQVNDGSVIAEEFAKQVEKPL